MRKWCKLNSINSCILLTNFEPTEKVCESCIYFIEPIIVYLVCYDDGWNKYIEEVFRTKKEAQEYISSMDTRWQYDYEIKEKVL
jgi:hypothetical protein